MTAKPASEVRRRPGSEAVNSGSSAYLRTGLVGTGCAMVQSPVGGHTGAITCAVRLGRYSWMLCARPL